MTREETIKVLEKEKAYMLGHGGDYQAQALSMAIKALENEPCEDAVSRQAVFETIDDCNKDGLKGIFCSYDDGERFKEYIKKLPSVKPVSCIATFRFSKEVMQELVDEKMKDIVVELERKKGKWKHDYSDTLLECSKCGRYYDTGFLPDDAPKYCPNCGAEMEVENNG